MLSHAFMMAVHKGYEQVVLLCEELSFGDVFIHVDLQADALYEQLKNRYKGSENVHLLTDRVNIVWSGFSQVEATLRLMRAVRLTEKHYDYIHFISGQDILLLKQESLDRLLHSNDLDTEYVEAEDIGSFFWRLRCFSFFRENPKNRTPLYRLFDILFRLPQLVFVRRNNFKGYSLYKGSSWFSITQNFLEYALKEGDTADYKKRFTYTACPDEHFFQVLVMNSRFKEHVKLSNLRYVRFRGLNTSPDVLTSQDRDLFMNGQYVFARKFEDIDEEKRIIEKRL